MLYTHKTVCKTVQIINHQTTIRKGHIFSSSICLDVASPDAKLILLILLIVTIFRRHFHHGTCDTLTWCNYLHTGTERQHLQRCKYAAKSRQRLLDLHLRCLWSGLVSFTCSNDATEHRTAFVFSCWPHNCPGLSTGNHQLQRWNPLRARGELLWTSDVSVVQLTPSLVFLCFFFTKMNGLN